MPGGSIFEAGDEQSLGPRGVADLRGQLGGLDPEVGVRREPFERGQSHGQRGRSIVDRQLLRQRETRLRPVALATHQLLETKDRLVTLHLGERRLLPRQDRVAPTIGEKAVEVGLADPATLVGTGAHRQALMEGEDVVRIDFDRGEVGRARAVAMSPWRRAT